MAEHLDTTAHAKVLVDAVFLQFFKLLDAQHHTANAGQQTN
jgi:hypothetical protein